MTRLAPMYFPLQLWEGLFGKGAAWFWEFGGLFLGEPFLGQLFLLAVREAG